MSVSAPAEVGMLDAKEIVQTSTPDMFLDASRYMWIHECGSVLDRIPLCHVIIWPLA